ncbi:uncharacterized protein RJT20DRAFT_51598 [Scheffersomyces xylosifermentans]|uniref:uncharacterized protein n=1 Tax=Scheffersomyces xylosifermentans TaxID=1304137 RepID=UPI00315D746F
MSEEPHTNSSTEGASVAEQLLEAARRNNTELLLSIKVALNNDQEKLASLINNTRELISDNTALHMACQLGNWEFIDIVLDIEGVEIDPKNREGDTPLHLAVKYTIDEPEHGYFIIDNLLDAGSDPRVIDKHNLRPIDYVNKDNVKLRELLESAQYAISMEVPEEEQLNGEGAGAAKAVEDDDDEASASDSD